MSEHSLPEDLASWPMDPFRLLGVSDSTSKRDVQRAYVKLIRQFKPERFPEHFKRLREAYEYIASLAETGSLHPMGEPIEVPGREEAVRRAPRRDSRDGVDESDSDPEKYWNLAAQGDSPRAYRKLRRLAERNPNDLGLKLQLYWLLALEPNLDPKRSACDLLVDGLTTSPRHWPFLELYCRHLDFDRKEVTSARCGRLARLDMPEEMLQAFLTRRWTAAERLNIESKAIGRDLAAIKDQILQRSEQEWLRLLFLSMDHLAWSLIPESRELFETYAKEAESLDHWPELGPYFSRLDQLRILMKEWKKAEEAKIVVVLPPIKLVPLYWRNPSLISRKKFIQLLEPFADASELHLSRIGKACNQCPNLFVQVLNLLVAMSNEGAELYERQSSAAFERRLFEFFAWNCRWLGYQEHRSKLFRLFIHESMDPLRIAAMVKDRPEYSFSDCEFLASCLESDLPLLCAWHAHHAFWAGVR